MRISNAKSRWAITVTICLGLMVGLTGNGYGQSEAYGTGVPITCKEGNDHKPFEIVFASLFTPVSGRDGASLCLILKPSTGESKKEKTFCAYRIDRKITRDNSTGAAEHRNLDGSFKDKLNEFVKKTSNCTVGQASENLIGEMNNVLQKGVVDAKGLIRIVNPKSTPIDVKYFGSFNAVQSIEDFPRAVHAYFKNVSAPVTPDTAGTGGAAGNVAGKEAAEIENLRKVIDELRTANNKLINDLRDKPVEKHALKEYLVSYLWFWALGAAILGAILIFYLRRFFSKVKNFQETTPVTPKNADLNKDRIREGIYDDLIRYLRSNDRHPNPISPLKDEVSSFSRVLAQLEERLGVREKEIQDNLDKKRKYVGSLLEPPHIFSTKRQMIERNEKLIGALNQFFHEHSILVEHSSYAISQYAVLYSSLNEKISKFWLKHPSPGPSDNAWMEEVKRSVANLAQEIRADLVNQNAELQNYKLLTDAIKRQDRAIGGNSLLIQGENLLGWVERMISEQRTSLSLLPAYRPKNSVSVVDKIKVIADSLSLASGAITQQVPTASGTIDQLVNLAMEELRRARIKAGQADALERERNTFRDTIASLEPEIEAGKKLSEKIVQYIGLKRERVFSLGQAAKTILQTIESESPEGRELRFRLLAVRIAFEKAKQQSENENMIKALRINEWLPKLEALPDEMQDIISRDEILGLNIGFSRGWLHDLLRAELLMNGYFAESDANFLLRDAIFQASTAVRAALFKYGCKVARIKLFEPAPDGVNIERDSDPLLRPFPEIEEMIVRKFKERKKSDHPGFVIDVESFPFSIDNQRKNVGKVVIMNPSNWLQK